MDHLKRSTILVVGPKTIVGITVTAKASHITYNEIRIYGSFWKLKKIKGVVITYARRVPGSSTQKVTFITMEWSLPGRIVINS